MLAPSPAVWLADVAGLDTYEKAEQHLNRTIPGHHRDAYELVRVKGFHPGKLCFLTNQPYGG